MKEADLDGLGRTSHRVGHSPQMGQSGEVCRISLQHLRHARTQRLAYLVLAPLASAEGMPHGVGDSPVVEDYLRDISEIGPLIEPPLQIAFGALDEMRFEVIGEEGKHEFSCCIDALSAHVVTIVLICQSHIGRNEPPHHVAHEDGLLPEGSIILSHVRQQFIPEDTLSLLQ